MSTVCYCVRHDTLYRYEGKVAHSHQQLHLTPRESKRQHCLTHRIDITPEPSEWTEHMDAFGNRVTRVELERPHDRLEVVAEMRVELQPMPQLDPQAGQSWESVRDQLRYSAQSCDPEWLEAMRFRGESPYVRIKRAFGDFAHDCLEPEASVLSVASAVMSKVYREFRYEPGATHIATPLVEVFDNRSGVCQDFAHLMIASLRSAGLAARYVSGYLHTGAAAPAPAAASAQTDESEDQAPEDAPSKMLGADASHAWVSVFAPPYGWVDFDPTNNLRVNQEHVALAWGRDFGDVSPLRGVILGGGSHRLSVKVAVEKTTQPRAP